MLCDSRASELGCADLWGQPAERLECAQERQLSFVTLRHSLTRKYGHNRTDRQASEIEGLFVLLSQYGSSEMRSVMKSTNARTLGARR